MTQSNPERNCLKTLSSRVSFIGETTNHCNFAVNFSFRQEIPMEGKLEKKGGFDLVPFIS